MSPPRKPRRKQASGDAGSIPEDTIEKALPLVAEDYTALIANSPKGEPAPDPKQVVAHYAAAHAVLAHLVELSELAGRKHEEAPAGSIAEQALAQARASMARAGMDQEAGEQPSGEEI